jgi:hypothetical protein
MKKKVFKLIGLGVLIGIGIFTLITLLQNFISTIKFLSEFDNFDYSYYSKALLGEALRIIFTGAALSLLVIFFIKIIKNVSILTKGKYEDYKKEKQHKLLEKKQKQKEKLEKEIDNLK